MCSSFYLTISAVYPMYNHLMDHAKKRINNTQISEKITMVAQATWDKLKQYYNKISNSFHYVATILDPRWKLKYFKSWASNKEDEVYFNVAKDLFNSKFDECRSIYFPTSMVDTNNTLNNDDDDDDDSLFPVSKQARYSNSYDELNHYLESSPEPSTTNMLEWWKTYENKYPILAIIAWDYTCWQNTDKSQIQKKQLLFVKD
ncbi:zinc finger BED domain-containing protein DAYSLEEPER-like isoform X1 [Gigaspora margarita]|uniref:Zinc finger BED domain-containing protein DAYSLEEPER-like isoform X1 n=1 Tax=Gigaspora margarita TaxID=4874 RepID=A0A8H3X5P5_GIGMA|nr:zinc finger BED domain-containing protein DAYSLEEPER-like isoform X1 [Gigaspora margarita]